MVVIDTDVLLLAFAFQNEAVSRFLCKRGLRTFKFYAFTQLSAYRPE
jgi:hypothetical protein